MFTNLSQPVVLALFEVSIKALVLYGIAALIIRVGRALTVHAQHRVWTVVLLMWLFMPLVMLGGLSWPLPVSHWHTEPTYADVNATADTPATVSTTNASLSDRSSVHFDESAEAQQSTSQNHPINITGTNSIATAEGSPAELIGEPLAKPEVASASTDEPRPLMYHVLMTTWMVGVIVMLARLAFALGRASVICQRARLLNEASLPRGIDMRESEDVSSPVVVGWWRPCILLPATWREWTEAKRQAVLAHEQSHLQRGDAIVCLLAEILTVFYWFHPLSWGVKRRLGQLAELACDEAAAVETGDRFRYAQHLIEIASAIPSTARTPAGIAMARSSEISHRVRSLLNASRPLTSRASLTSLIAILTLGVPSALLIAAAEPEVVSESKDSIPAANNPTTKTNHVDKPVDQKTATAPPLQSPDTESSHSKEATQGEQRRFNPRDTTVPIEDRLSTDPETRVLELIYILRNYRVFSRDEEMFQAVRELTRIGKPALPALIAELDRTDREQTIRALGIALRAMNDHRAVHALIRAIPKTLRSPESDCGVYVINPELRKFMLNLERHPPSKDKANPSISVGRPVNEILGTLEKMTGFLPPEGMHDPLRYVFLSKEVNKQPSERQQFKERQDSWIKWWSENGSKFLTADQLLEFQQPAPLEENSPGGFDKVDRAGRARFGPLFPTGPEVRLGPVHEVELFDAIAFADAPSSIDFDRERTLRLLEGAKNPARGLYSWQVENGIDFVQGIHLSDTQLWTIDPDRWDTIENEICLPLELQTGTEFLGDFVTRPPEQNTMLLKTREGGCGVIQLEPYNPQTASRVIRYRMWQEEGSVASVAPERSPGWGETIRVKLPVIATSSKSFWSIDKQKAFELELKLSPEELRNQLLTVKPGETTSVDAWRVQQSVNFFPFIAQYSSDYRGPIDSHLELHLFDGKIREVRPQAFESMTSETAKTLLDEHSTIEFRKSLSFTKRGWPYACYLFTTTGNHSGILQITRSDETAGVIEFQYKLIDK